MEKRFGITQLIIGYTLHLQYLQIRYAGPRSNNVSVSYAHPTTEWPVRALHEHYRSVILDAVPLAVPLFHYMGNTQNRQLTDAVEADFQSRSRPSRKLRWRLRTSTIAKTEHALRYARSCPSFHPKGAYSAGRWIHLKWNAPFPFWMIARSRSRMV